MLCTRTNIACRSIILKQTHGKRSNLFYQRQGMKGWGIRYKGGQNVQTSSLKRSTRR